MIKFKLLILSILTITFPLLAEAQLMNNVTLRGKVSNAAKDSKVFLLELGPQGMIPVDSSKLKADNSFLIQTNVERANFFQLTLGGKAYTIVIIEPNQNIEINLNATNMMNPGKISGSKETQKVYTTLGVLNSYKAKQDELESEYQKFYGTPKQDSVGKILMDKYQKIDGLRLEYLRNEINREPSLASLLFIDQLKIEENVNLYEKLDQKLYKKYPKNPFIKDLHHKVESKLKLAIGRFAPEISLPSTNGEFIKLSSLKGKVVLIDFWASWCGPCRRESPNMVKLYNQYKDKGFEIYSVSLDKEKSSWIKAIKDDGLNWTHVSDLRYWSSVAAKEYGVSSIPFTVLLDKSGRIIAVGLRGAQLEQKLAEIMK